MLDSYMTIAFHSEGEYKAKGSKFLAFAYPVSNEAEIQEILSEKKKQFYDARHVCYAYRFGFPNETYRVNDDGEPSGTAGKPIYGQLLSFDLMNILVVVVRYFGGTKLGVRGLINAYREATIEAIEANEIVERVMTQALKIQFSYEQLNDVMRVLKEENLSDFKQDFQLDCKMDVQVRLSDLEMLKEKLLAIYGVTTRNDSSLI